MGRKQAYLDSVNHDICRESLKKILAGEAFTKQLDKANGKDATQRVMSRIYPAWLSQVRSRKVPADVYTRCAISRHLRLMSSSSYRKNEFAVKALTDLGSSRWAR